jgi:hypothetical protein
MDLSMMLCAPLGQRWSMPAEQYAVDAVSPSRPELRSTSTTLMTELDIVGPVIPVAIHQQEE